MSATSDIKDEFYENLIAIISSVHNNEQFVLMGGVNANHWHQLDLILFRRAALKNVLNTRSYDSAACNTDHSLVCCPIRLQPKRVHRTKK